MKGKTAMIFKRQHLIKPDLWRMSIVTGGTHSRVCRFVIYDATCGHYAVHIAKRGQLGRKIASGDGPPDEAVKHGCADNQFLNMPGVWKRGAEQGGLEI